MLHFVCNNNFEGDHQAFGWICTLLSNIISLDDKNQSSYRDLAASKLFLILARGFFAVWYSGQTVLPLFFLYFFVSWGLNIADFWASDKINFPIV